MGAAANQDHKNDRPDRGDEERAEETKAIGKESEHATESSAAAAKALKISIGGPRSRFALAFAPILTRCWWGFTKRSS